MNDLLGKKAKAKVSGFEGVITALCEYLHGPSRACLTAKSKDGKAPEEYWTEEDDIELIKGDDIKK